MAESVSSSTTVPCSCPTSGTGGDGLDVFDLQPSRRIQNLGQVTEQAWHSMQIDLEIPRSPIVLVPRVGHALVNLPERKEIYMIGGGNHEGPLTEIWRISYSGNDGWEIGVDLLSLDFPPRYEFFCGLNKEQDKIWIFGGADLTNTYNDVLYVGVEAERHVVREVMPPPQVVDLSEEVSEVSGQEVNDVPTAGITPILPSSRTQGNNSCIVEINGQENLVIFGGGVGKDKSVADGHLYMFNTSGSTWSEVKVSGSIPTPVQGHGMVAIGSKVYMFGGMENMLLYNDFFMIDVGASEPKWSKIRSTAGRKPEPRAAHGTTVIGNNIYIFGGVGEHGSLSDLWKYDTEANVWTLLDSGMRTVNDQKSYQIQPRLNMAMTSVSVGVTKDGATQNRDFLVINGGMNIMGHLFDDTWVFPLFNQF